MGADTTSTSHAGPTGALVGMELLPGAEAEAIVEAAQEEQDDVVISRNAAVVIVSAPNRLEIDPGKVRDYLGRDDWAGPDIQVIMASYFGFITRLDDDGIILEWLRGDAGREGNAS